MSKAPKSLFRDAEPEIQLEYLTEDIATSSFQLSDPDPSDPRFSAFFIDLDAQTQYHEAYGNPSHYMDISLSLIRGPAVKAWQRWARRENHPDGPARRSAFIKAASVPETAADVLEIDEMMHKLLLKHFPDDEEENGIDASPYLGAMELFAKDQLPADQDRLQRVGGGGEDVSHHRMDGFGMWFHWAAVYDCARFAPNGGGENSYRSLMVGAAAFGSAIDSAFRQRARTRAEYKNDEATNQLLRTEVMSWIQDGEAASAQARELFRIFTNAN